MSLDESEARKGSGVLCCTDAGWALALVVLTLAVYYRVVSGGFLLFDDNVYILENEVVRAGFTRAGVFLALTRSYAANWHPLTWFSHMLDVELFGLDPRGHHAVNLAFHALNTCLLYFALRSMAGPTRPSAFVAALFAVHPLHVESVAWVAERKDLLCGLFWILTMISYVRYVRRGGRWRYFGVLLSFALCLMSKPMGVTLPAILLFVDFWPLQRWPVGSIGWRAAASDDHPGTGNRESGIPVRRLVLEKVPLFVLAALSSVVTYVAQSRGGAVKAMGGFPLDSRIANAVLSYWAYLGKALWPTRLSAFYPYGSPTLTDGGVIVGALAMAAFTAAAWRWRRRTPYLLMGWAWYLIGLLPVIGLLQMGEQAMADRYTYLPLVGPFVALSWGAADLARRWPPARRLLLGAACAVTVALAGVAWRQTAHWRTTETLFAQALRATGANWFAHNNYGAALIAEGRTEEAAAHFREAIRIRPRYPQGHFNLGVALQKLGQTGEARESYRAALAVRPRYWEAHFRLGGLYEAIGGLGEAEAEYSAAVEADPGEMLSQYRLGALLARRDQFAEAERHLREVVREMPRLAEARNTLGVALAGMGRTSEAVVQFEEALRLQPGYGEARFNLDAVRGEMPARAAASRGTGDR